MPWVGAWMMNRKISYLLVEALWKCVVYMCQQIYETIVYIYLFIIWEENRINLYTIDHITIKLSNVNMHLTFFLYWMNVWMNEWVNGEKKGAIDIGCDICCLQASLLAATAAAAAVFSRFLFCSAALFYSQCFTEWTIEIKYFMDNLSIKWCQQNAQ